MILPSFKKFYFKLPKYKGRRIHTIQAEDILGSTKIEMEIISASQMVS